jgi:hypothetical protein
VSGRAEKEIDWFTHFLSFVMPGLVPGIHALTKDQQERRGWPEQKGVHARLRRAMPGHDDI